MQFLIDTDAETHASMLLAARVLTVWAEGMAELEAAVTAPKPIKAPIPPPISQPLVSPAPPAPLPPGNVPPAPVIHPPVHPDAQPTDDVPAGTPDPINPAVLFGGNRAPLAPPPPPAPDAATVITAPPPPAPIAIPIMNAPTPPAATVPAATVVSNAGAPPAASALPAQATAPLLNGTAPPTNERDSEGLPWDARIHSETRKTNADGTWRYRRNLDPAVKAAVYAELKAAAGQQVSPPAAPVGATSTSNTPVVMAPPPPSPPEIVAPPPPVTATVLSFPSPPPAVPVQPATDVGVPNTGKPPVVQTVTSFRDLMQKVNQALAAGRITQPQLSEACKAAGVDSVAALAAQPMLVPTVDTYLNRWLAA